MGAPADARLVSLCAQYRTGAAAHDAAPVSYARPSCRIPGRHAASSAARSASASSGLRAPLLAAARATAAAFADSLPQGNPFRRP
jgi:hypothetical protein